MEWVASTLHTTSELCTSSITTADTHTSVASSQLNRDPADLNGLVRFAERRNIISTRVPSHFKRSLPLKKVMNKRTSFCFNTAAGTLHVELRMFYCCEQRKITSQALLCYTQYF